MFEKPDEPTFRRARCSRLVLTRLDAIIELALLCTQVTIAYSASELGAASCTAGK